MLKTITNTKQRLLKHYVESDFLLQKKSNALLIFNVTIIAIIALLLAVMIFAAPEKAGIVAPVITIIITGLLISTILLSLGFYSISASVTTLTITLLLIAALYGRTTEFPDTIYSSNFYFLMTMIVVGTLFNSRGFVLGLTLFIIANNVALFMIIKNRLTGEPLATATNGCIYSICAILTTTVISQLLYSIFKSSILKINEEVALNKQQYDMIQTILSSAQESSTQLSFLAGNLDSASDTFSSNSQSQAASIEEITASIEEINAGMDNMLGASHAQNDDVSGLVDDMKILSGNIKDVESISGTTLRLTDSIADQIHSGEQSLKKMNSSLDMIFKSAGDINNIVHIIDDISDRINLLSLNAAIEAARAGDSGRGFAVVADEISKLADQTATSIKEVDNLIRTAGAEIQKGKNDVEDVTEKITSVVSGINEIVEMMNKIFSNVKKQMEVNNVVTGRLDNVENESEKIRMWIDEQNQAFTEIIKSIGEINATIQTAAGESANMAQSVKKISSLSVSLEDMIHSK